MNIFKTFEIFLREPLSILRERFIQIVSVQSNIASNPPSLNVDLLDKKAQITVVNSEKMYNLLSTVNYRQRRKAEEKLLPENNKQVVIGQLMKRK